MGGNASIWLPLNITQHEVTYAFRQAHHPVPTGVFRRAKPGRRRRPCLYRAAAPAAGTAEPGRRRRRFDPVAGRGAGGGPEGRAGPGGGKEDEGGGGGGGGGGGVGGGTEKEGEAERKKGEGRRGEEARRPEGGTGCGVC